MKEMTKISGFSKNFTQNAFAITNICYLCCQMQCIMYWNSRSFL